MKTKDLPEVGHFMVSLLSRRKNVIDPRYRPSVVSWIVRDRDWYTPVWIHLTYYSSAKDIIRFRNDLLTKLPKSQWQFALPDLFRFELTALMEEVDSDLATEVIEYCELARRQPNSKFDRNPPHFPRGSNRGSYGWTEAAWDLQNTRSESK